MSHLLLPPASGDLQLALTIQSGCVGYIEVAYDNLAPSGVTLEIFLTKEIIERSLICYVQSLAEDNYNKTEVSGVQIRNDYSNFVVDIDSEKNDMINQVKIDLGYGA